MKQSWPHPATAPSRCHSVHRLSTCQRHSSNNVFRKTQLAVPQATSRFQRTCHAGARSLESEEPQAVDSPRRGISQQAALDASGGRPAFSSAQPLAPSSSNGSSAAADASPAAYGTVLPLNESISSGSASTSGRTNSKHAPESHLDAGSEKERRRRRRLWFAAIKPPMYSVGIIPILVSAGAAYAATGVFVAGCFWRLIGGAVLVIAWLNLSNDAFDAETGVDADKAESVVNLTRGNRHGVLALANACLAAGALLLSHGISATGDARVGAALAAAIFMGYLYQGPPFRLSYKGLGEPLCFLAFGPLATCAFYLAQVGAASGGAAASVSPAAAACSVLVGLTTSAILFCSHFHQIRGDRAAGKMSPLVHLGPRRGFQVLRAAVYAAYLLMVAAAALGWLPRACLPAQLLSIPAARALLGFAARTHMDPEAVRPLKKYALKWHMALGAALAACLALSRDPALHALHAL